MCTHCHYDHIGGIAAFAADKDTRIVAPAGGKDFITQDLDTHSLYKFLHPPLKPPKYDVTAWASDGEILSHGNK